VIRRQRVDWLDGGFVPASVPRLAEPELRSRVAGYLAYAPIVDGGDRSGADRCDGVWVWPERLARSVLEAGVGPSHALLSHMAARQYHPPASVPGPTLADAARAIAAPPPTLEQYFVDNTGQVWTTGDSGGFAPVVPIGLAASAGVATISAAPAGLVGISPTAAAAALDGATRSRFEELRRRSRETVAVPGELRLARVFDHERAGGQPGISPDRLRLPDPDRRDRVAGYLAAGQLVARATGRMPDPLALGTEPVVPLGWRTDGVWVWQEALTYYVRRRAIAPEAEFLGHIEARDCRPTERALTPAEVTRAAAAVRAGPQPWLARPEFRYWAHGSDVARVVAGGSDAEAEVLDRDLRWRPLPAAALSRPADRPSLEAAVVERIIEDRCLAGAGFVV